MWNKFPNTPPNIPETEDFGIDYEVKYNLPNGKIETTITEWLWEKKWNCIYPVIAWREYSPIIPFRHWNDDLVRKDIKKYMMDCKFLVIEDTTSYHGDVFDHPDYKYTCEKCKQEVIPFLNCNEEKCKNYTKKSE